MDTKEMDEEIEDISALVAADGDKDTRAVYEAGYHLLPTLSEDDVAGETAALHGLLKEQDVETIGERTPAVIDLAYPMEKYVDGVRQSFTTAHFSWVAFEASPSSLETIDNALKTNKNILRHIIIKTSRDAVAMTLADPTLDVPTARMASDEGSAVSEALEGATLEPSGINVESAEA